MNPRQNHSHFKILCTCGTVLQECGCVGAKMKQTTRLKDGCEPCKVKATRGTRAG